MSDIKQKAFSNFDFIAMLSHDLKTPVKAQTRAVNLLYSGCFGEFSPEAKNVLLNIIASNKYMQSILDNILGRYRLAKGDFVLNKTNNDFRKTLEETLLNVGVLSEIKGQKVKINYLSEDYIKKYDEIEIQRVLMNLFINAFEYGRENTTVSLTVEDINKQLSFKIESKIKKIYTNPVVKNLATTSYGLGLKICEKIIALHNGIFYKEVIEDEIYKTGFVLP